MPVDLINAAHALRVPINAETLHAVGATCSTDGQVLNGVAGNLWFVVGLHYGLVVDWDGLIPRRLDPERRLVG